jgi:hypothetical protein
LERLTRSRTIHNVFMTRPAGESNRPPARPSWICPDNAASANGRIK